MLVSSQLLAKPIIGFIVSEELAQTNMPTDEAASKFVPGIGSVLDVGPKNNREKATISAAVENNKDYDIRLQTRTLLSWYIYDKGCRCCKNVENKYL